MLQSPMLRIVAVKRAPLRSLTIFRRLWVFVLCAGWATAAAGQASSAAGGPESLEASERPAPESSRKTITRIRAVTFAERDGQALTADIYIPGEQLPEGTTTRRAAHPGVLMIHGGAWATGTRWSMVGHANLVAERGFTVVSINYRLAPQSKFPAQIEDCKEAVRWMRRNSRKYHIDPAWIAAYGYSAGGHLAALLGVSDASHGLEGLERSPAGRESARGVEDDTRVQAVVAGGAPCDFRDLPETSGTLSYFLGGTRQDKPEVYRLASPRALVSRDDPPFFFFHGEDDQLVPLSNPRGMLASLREAEVAATLYLAPNRGHIGAFVDGECKRRAADFLEGAAKRSLRAASP